MWAADIYGCSPQVVPATGSAAPTAYMGTDNVASGLRGLVDPHNPLMWFGAVLLVTVGAASLAGSVRLGRAKVSGSVGT